ncbi:RNA-guided endonuclease TnpB family protein [Pusillimonas sp. ANT_WB101]|uniref:RNA-guided endonuclease InsQ/TnpB family protein n=1 Tax=Pusillimonas sp. ANT_WB101 TaxID=2597356 RepID=UPI0011F05A5A|nr:RNA-guided endonuclease TnpB family protein [Pusillimonas sp. ANT_WB101]KAA0911302.1 transposase [Pusillimonas sp. ANT_WB101]
MQIGNRFRCYPTPVQQRKLLQWIGCQRFIYNAKVGEDRYYRNFARKSLSHVGKFAPIDQQYSQFKNPELTPWLYEVPSQLLRNGATKWKQAYSRFFSGLGGRPTIQTRHGKQSVWLTNELFSFVPATDPDTGEVTHTLHIGTKKHPIGALAFVAHRGYQPPSSIHLSVHARRWHVSFNYEDGVIAPTEEESAEWLRGFSAPELAAMTLGLDRGVNIPLAGSDGQQFDFSEVQKKRVAKQIKYKKRWQRRQARRVKGSGRWKKAKQRVARYQRYGADVRRDFCHQTSHALVTDTRYKLFVFEALNVKNMTASAKGSIKAPGKNVRQKTGLNRSILASGWVQIKLYTHYKARRAGKLSIEVPAHYSSQECSQCGFTHQDNRLSQAVFVCQRCHHTDNADTNAAKVLVKRGVSLILSDGLVKKSVKRVGITKQRVKEVGAGCSEPAGETQPTLVEIVVNRQGGNTLACVSLKRETPATTLGV